MYRTHNCGELRKSHEGKNVMLAGWINSVRQHGNVCFADIRDRYGITQIVINKVVKLRREFCISIEGVVKTKPEPNKKLATGDIEVHVNTLDVLSESDVLPLDMEDMEKVTEDTRLKYRYLDLRREEMKNNIIMRHKIIKAVRDFCDSEGFVEIETPILAKSTPEGARDYLVPSRVHKGKFFALPQSPQLFKQLLMVSGFDKYMQIARCFRDEDLRADRQPEFTQIDIEMSFVDENDIYAVNEKMMTYLWKKIFNKEVKTPFPRISYQEAMDRYGIDRPDTRFGLELVDVKEIVKKSDFNVLKNAEMVRCINAVGCAGFSRKEIDELTEIAKTYKAKGLVAIAVEDGLKGSAAKFFNDSVQKELIKKCNAKNGDLLLIVADNMHSVVYDSLANVRLFLGKKLIKEEYNFLWVTDFPLLEWDHEEKRHMAVHHPFTSPKDDDIQLLDKDPGKARAKAYDLTLNGVEIAGGSIRIHRADVQQKIFKLLNISEKEAQNKFGFLLDAFKYGPPPHGGIAYGLDRLVAIMTGNSSIREVIAFPKNKNCVSLMDNAPNTVDEAQLDEAGIKLR